MKKLLILITLISAITGWITISAPNVRANTSCCGSGYGGCGANEYCGGGCGTGNCLNSFSCCWSLCTPNCTGKCGGASDGCGGTCNAACTCTPNCSGDQCGQSNGCGGTCGSGDRGTCGKCGNGPCSSGGSCDSGCGTCGYRTSSGSCSSDNGCCHRTCSGSSCVTVSGGGTNSCSGDPNCASGSTPPPAQDCTGINYVLNPLPPEIQNTNIQVDFDRYTANMGSCGINNVGYELDGVQMNATANQYGLALCNWAGLYCGSGFYHALVPAGLAGTHTLQFTTNNDTCKCNTFTFSTSAPTCSLNFTGIPTGTSIVKGTTAQFIAHIVPQNGATINGWTVDVPPTTNVTLTPSSETISPASASSVDRTITINTTFLSTGPFQITGGGTTAQGTNCPYSSTPISIVDPTTKFIAAAGGDVVVLGSGSMGTNMAQPYPTYPLFTYFADKNLTSATPGMGLGNKGASWFGNLDSSNVNSLHWLVDTGSGGWTNLLGKSENNYQTIKLRVLNKVPNVTSVANTSSWQTALTQALANTSGSINGVSIINVTGGDWTIGAPAQPIDVNSQKLLFLVDGSVNINGEIHRDKANGGFLAIFASGNMTVNGGVGTTAVNITLDGVLPQLEGIFYTQGTFSAGSSPDNRLKINGTVIGMSGVDLLGRTVTGIYPSLYFNFQPDLTAALNNVGLRKKTFQELLTP